MGMDLLDWLMENVMPWILILIVVAVFVVFGYFGYDWMKHRHDPVITKAIAAKHESTTQVLVGQTVVNGVSTGGWLMPITTYSFSAPDGWTCSTDAQEYAARKEGDLEPCRWRAP